MLRFILLFCIASVLSETNNEHTVRPEETDRSTSDETESPNEDIIHTEILDMIFLNTSIGSTHDITIPEYIFYEDKTCKLVNPNGLSYSFDQLNIPGVEVMTDGYVACGISITVVTENIIGNWRLVFAGTKFGSYIEKVLPFEVYVEEIVQPAADEVTIVRGNDFYFRLNHATEFYKTCEAIKPSTAISRSVINDVRYQAECGFICTNVTAEDSGTWEIRYGSKIIYRAFIRLNVEEPGIFQQPYFSWTRNKPIQVTVGPEDAVYCTVIAPDGFVVYDAFGRCNITLERVTNVHHGQWKMLVATPGRVITDEITFNVALVDSIPKPEVSTRVTAEQPIVTLSCNVSTSYTIRTCKFRKPSGQVLIATEGIGESRYTFHGKGVSYESGVHTHDCGLQITDPPAADLGIWRCALETEEEIYYGFLYVAFPWGMRDPEVVAQVVTEPVLTADRDQVNSVVGDAVSLTCSVQSMIRYCYFRSSNGTVYNVSPDQSHDHATYVGAGFDAGDCGIRFPSLQNYDSGRWSCHVGFPNASIPEQRANIHVYVQEQMVGYQRMVHEKLQIEAQVSGMKELEYCRYVRIDGLGFLGGEGAVMPRGYFSIQSLATGRCGIVVEYPSMLEHHNWTIIAKVKGQNEELFVVTDGSFDIPGGLPPQTVVFRLPCAWVVIMAISLTLLLLTASLGPEKNRKWTFKKTKSLRTSFRNSFAKKAAAPQDNNNTSVAAY